LVANKKISDKDKLVALGTMLNCQVTEKGRTLILSGRRYTFNDADEIVKVQDIIHSPAKGFKYRTLAKDSSVE
jgi:hypothetical protein